MVWCIPQFIQGSRGNFAQTTHIAFSEEYKISRLLFEFYYHVVG